MGATGKLVAGFDPGGKSGNKFGWCVAEFRPWRVIAANGASCADDAFCRASQAVETHGGRLVAAGIDAPLTWARNGGQRKADKHVQQWGTASGVNSLWGACLVQGFLLAKVLEEKHPKCLITETNPKALLNCVSAAREALEGAWKEGESEDVRDAIVSAWAAAQASESGRGGVNLYDGENKDQVYRVSAKAVYWWPPHS